MSFVREMRRIEPTPVTQAVVVAANCDCCGRDCWHGGHRRPWAVLSRVQDDGHGNMDIWDLDLCEECKEVLLQALRLRAAMFERELPQHREDDFKR